jgi:antitoxin (DNA-binding transcriptional repressor) of toxin-antitoxin stability system
MALTASELREDVYRILDQILETGVPVEIERRGQLLKIVPVEARKKLDNLTERPEFLRCDPEEIVSLDWPGEWQP